MKDSLILVANPGGASRKYALYQGDKQLLNIHFENVGGKVVYSLGGDEPQPAGISHIAFASSRLDDIIRSSGVIDSNTKIDAVVLRVVAPSSIFQQHHKLDEVILKQLKSLTNAAPIHINATLQEVDLMARFLSKTKLIGASDSAFHATLPSHAANYGIPGQAATQLDIKRFGYHGLSVESVVDALKEHHSMPERLLVCHLGSGASVTAVKHGKSIDNTMGYSPLEGLLMATRSGNIDPTATLALQSKLKLSPIKLQEYLNHASGLLGVSGLSDDIRELLAHEDSQPSAKLALNMYVYRAQQAVGQMAAALGGLDAVIFTGTVGERSAVMRRRICQKLRFLGIELARQANSSATNVKNVTKISPAGSPVAVYVIPTDEMGQMAQAAQDLLS